MSDELTIHTDRKVYSIPDGLNELMYDISKEVLRCQPKNLYQFISDYLITLLKVREAVKVAVPLVEKEFETVESETNILKKYNLNKEQGDRFATIIQAAYRGYRTRNKLLLIADDIHKGEVLSTITQPISEEVFFTDPMFSFLRTRGISKEETKEAATKIQAFYRGFRVRKFEREKGVECLVKGVPSHESWRHDWIHETMVKKEPVEELYPWRKSFTDFHRNYARRIEGDRLQMETIYEGKYEDYNQVCDKTSCQEFIIPTKLEAKELAVPGEFETSSSEELDLPGAREMRDIVMKSIVETPIAYEEFKNELEFLKKVSEVKEREHAAAKSTEDKEREHAAAKSTEVKEREHAAAKSTEDKEREHAAAESTEDKEREHAAAESTEEEKAERESSEYLGEEEGWGEELSKGSKKSSHSIAVSQKSRLSQGSKRRESKGSVSEKSRTSIKPQETPELSVRSLSIPDEQLATEDTTTEDQFLSRTSKSSVGSEQRSIKGSRKSSVKSAVTSATTLAAEEVEKKSKGSKTSVRSSKSASSKKSLVETEPPQE